jgi:hypothetical protein
VDSFLILLLQRLSCVYTHVLLSLSLVDRSFNPSNQSSRQSISIKFMSPSVSPHFDHSSKKHKRLQKKNHHYPFEEINRRKSNATATTSAPGNGMPQSRLRQSVSQLYPPQQSTPPSQSKRSQTRGRAWSKEQAP